MLLRRAFRLPAALALTATLGLLAPTESGAAEAIDFGLSSSTSLVNLPCFVAKEAGLFEKYGLDVEFVDSNSGSKAATAIIAGDVGIGCTGGSYAIRAAQRGQSLKFVLPVLDQLTLALSVRDDVLEERGITADTPPKEIVRKLKGIHIGVSSPGSSTAEFAQFLITWAGMNPDSDFTIVPVGGNVLNVMAALERKTIDAATFSSPVPEWIEMHDEGRTVISLARGDIEELRGAYYVGLLVNKGFAEDHPEQVQAAVNAIADAQRMIREDPDKARQIGEKFLSEMDPKVYKAAFATIAQAVPETIKPMEWDGLRKLAEYGNEAKGAEGVKLTFDDVARNDFIQTYLAKSN